MASRHSKFYAGAMEMPHVAINNCGLERYVISATVGFFIFSFIYIYIFEELEFVFFFSRENRSTKESVESKGNVANFFAAEFLHVNVLSLRRKPGINQLVYERTPKVDIKMWRQAREVSRALSKKPDKGDTVACAFAENAANAVEKVFLVGWRNSKKIFKKFAGAPLILLSKFTECSFESISEYAQVSTNICVVRKIKDRWICCCPVFTREFTCSGVLGVQLFLKEVSLDQVIHVINLFFFR